MLLNATRPAQYSVSPSVSSFQTIAMAMQRAKPIKIKPIIYSGGSGKKDHSFAGDLSLEEYKTLLEQKFTSSRCGILWNLGIPNY